MANEQVLTNETETETVKGKKVEVLTMAQAIARPDVVKKIGAGAKGLSWLWDFAKEKYNNEGHLVKSVEINEDTLQVVERADGDGYYTRYNGPDGRKCLMPVEVFNKLKEGNSFNVSIRAQSESEYLDGIAQIRAKGDQATEKELNRLKRPYNKSMTLPVYLGIEETSQDDA